MNPKAYKAEIARRIKQAMQEYSDRHQIEALTYRRLHELCDKLLSVSRLSNYANAIRQPKPWEANILAAALEVDPAWLLCLKLDFTKQDLDVIRDLHALPEKDRNSYARRIHIMAMAYREPAPDEPAPAPIPAAKPGKKRISNQQ